MGYILAIILLLLVVPLLFILLSRRTSKAGGIRQLDRGVTVENPSSDQPKPTAPTDGPSTGRKLPPG